MSIKKNITIDGMEVPFKASAAVPRLYRLKFRRDIYKDFASLKTDVEEGDENKSELDIEALRFSRTSPTSWQNTLTLKTFPTVLMIFWNSSTPSVFMRSCHS